MQPCIPYPSILQPATRALATMAGLSTGAGAPVVMVYHEKSMILPDVSRVLACLYEKDVKFECVKDSYKDILRLQASRSVPVPFYDGPTFLQESRAICRYIAETYKQRGYPFLLGKDVLERASIEQWLRHEEHAFDPPSRALFCHLAFPMHDDDDDNINREKRKLEEVLAVYEQRLGESEFLAGNKFTLADLAHLPNTHHIVTSEKFAYLYDSRKNVQRWWNTISARDSWQQVLRDMKSVKEQYQMEEYEQQQQQRQKEPPQTYGGSNIRIDARAHTGTVSQIVVVPPPSTGFIATSFPSVQQEEQPPPAKTTSHDKSSPIQQKESNFFTTTEKTPTTTKTPPRTETDKSSSEDASSPTKPSQTSSKEAPDKMASSHTDEAATLTKPTPPQALKTSNRIHDSEAVAPDKPSPTSAKAPHKIDEPDFYDTESKPASVGPWADKPVSYTKPDPQTSKTPYTEPPAQRAADTSGPEAGETPSDQRSVMQTPDAQQRSEQDMMASTNQRAAARLAEKVAAKDAQGETAPQAGHHGARDITKEAREADQRKATSAPTRELPSGDQNGNQQSKAPPTDLKVSDSSPLEAEFKEDAQGAMSEDERFSTKRLRKMFEESEAAVLRSQSTDLQAPEKEETPSVYKKPSDVQDRKRQAGTISADGKTGTPSTGTRDPGTPTSADERRDTSPPKGGMAHDDHGATEPQKSPSSNKQEPAPPVPSQSPNSAGRDDDLAQLSTIDQWRHASAPPPIQQVSPGAPSIDEVAKTASVGRRAPTSTPKQTPTDARNALAPVQGAAPSADGISDEQSDKSIMDERVPELTQRQAPSSDTRHTSASIQEAISVPHGPSDDMLGKTSGTDQTATPGASKQTPARGEVPDVRDTSDDTTKKPAVDTKAAPTPPRQEPVSSSQQTTEQIKGVAPTSHGITGDESAKIAMADESETPPAPASDGRVASTALKGGILDARVKNEAVASVADPSGMPTTPRRPAPTPDTQRRTTPDQASDQAPPFPSFAETMNEKTGIAEAGRTNTIAPNEQPGMRIPKNAGAPAAGPSPMKSQKNVNEAYNDGPSIQQLSSDQSRAQLAENKKQGDDAIPLTEIGKPKEDDLLANANQNNTGQAQVTSTDGPSKLQMQSDQNKPISSKDIGKRTNETVSYKSSATSREMLPSVPEKSMSENQLQGDKSSISLQDNVKQGSEAALSVSGTKQPKKRDLLTNVDQNSGKTPGEAIQKSEERTSSDTQQVKSNTSNSKSDGSSKPTQFGGNEGNLPESQRRGSSTRP